MFIFIVVTVLVHFLCIPFQGICPVILPFGALFFGFSLMVYKKQVLYVYTPLYESGGTLFPLACDCTLFGLVCGQLTLTAYIVVKDRAHNKVTFPLVLFLPVMTIGFMRYFKRNYTKPSSRLSFERAIQRDKVADKMASLKDSENGVEALRDIFDHEAYRQPVLAENVVEPCAYRRDIADPLTEEACEAIRKGNRLMSVRQSRLRTGRPISLSSSIMSDPE